MPQPSNRSSIQIAIAWCLAWGSNLEPRYATTKFDGWRKAIAQGQTPSDLEWQQALLQTEALTELKETNTDFSRDAIAAFENQHTQLRDAKIGIVYGGVTKVKSYVFESADLQEVRGASALLERINLVDLPAFFHAENSNSKTYNPCKKAPSFCQQVRKEIFFPNNETEPLIAQALIPELIIYSTGGNILAFCPAAFTDELCNAIEKRYTAETLTANSCAVGITCRPVEMYNGLLKDPIDTTPWDNVIAADYKTNPAIQAYFGINENTSPEDVKKAFQLRKNFGELVGKLTSQFTQRRSGYNLPPTQAANPPRPSRQFPPMFETHPYLMRDDSDIRSAVVKLNANELPDEPKLSEPTARKRRVGQIVKRESTDIQRWYKNSGFQSLWNPAPTEERIFQSWVGKFENFLKDKALTEKYDHGHHLFDEHGNMNGGCEETREARSLHEIGASSNGYVGYIYADGNSMGQHIRDKIKTPADYQEFSADIFEATEKSVYSAIACHLHPYCYTPTAKSSRQPNKPEKDPVWIHPFEIITIGGDDVLLIVPANKALEVAQSIGKYFEEILLKHGEKYQIPPEIDISQQHSAHRYRPDLARPAKCRLSTSSGVLITAANTPIYYADKLVSQLLKSAKQQLKHLKDSKNGINYYGGTVDFLVLKAVTMVSSNIAEFRMSGLTVVPPKQRQTIKLYGAPYTLHELEGLIETVRAVKDANFPKSQMYQIRGLLERGKRTAILNYRYFRVRLKDDQQTLLKDNFEQAWCKASTNEGNLAPWLAPKRNSSGSQTEENAPTTYETIWRELVDLEPFIETTEPKLPKQNSAMPSQSSVNRGEV